MTSKERSVCILKTSHKISKPHACSGEKANCAQVSAGAANHSCNNWLSIWQAGHSFCTSLVQRLPPRNTYGGMTRFHKSRGNLLGRKALHGTPTLVFSCGQGRRKCWMNLSTRGITIWRYLAEVDVLCSLGEEGDTG